MIYKFLGTMMGKVILAAVIIVIVMSTITFCSSNRKAAEQGKQNIRNSEALIETIEKTAVEAANNASQDAKFDDIVDQAVSEIKGNTDEKVTRNITVNALCRLPNYRDTASCAMFETDTPPTGQ